MTGEREERNNALSAALQECTRLQNENAALRAQLAAMQQGRGRWVPDEVAEQTAVAIREWEGMCDDGGDSPSDTKAERVRLRVFWTVNLDALSLPTQPLDAPVPAVYLLFRGRKLHRISTERTAADWYQQRSLGDPYTMYEYRPYQQLQSQEVDKA